MEGKYKVSEEEITYALENHEFQAYYQPQYDTITNRLVSAEALVRWFKEDGSMVMPGEFIPVIEENGMVCDVDWYMLRETCDFLKRQKEKGNQLIPISVNFSRLHINEDNFLEMLCGVVDSYGISRKWIIVELTESAFVEQEKRICDWVKEVREKGFSVAIDDFGSGLSSLSFVKDVAVDILKIDRALLNQNCEDEKERIVLESIFYFAQRLKLTTVAEGVETIEQLGFLRTCDCKVIQGFLFAKPMPEEEFQKVFERDVKIDITNDILLMQAPSSATQLLLEAVFIRYPLVIFCNLTRNSYYMMAYENFSTTKCTSTGIYDELIAGGATTMHPEDQETFRQTFNIANQLEAYKRGEKYIRVVTRQLGDDGIYREVETSNYFVKNPSVDDVLVITLCHNLEE